MAENSSGNGAAQKQGGGYTVIAKTIRKTAEQIRHHAHNGDISLSSGKQVRMAGAGGGVRFAKYEPAQPRQNPDVEKLEFLREDNTVITQSALAAFGGIQASDFFYGEKAKIKVTTRNVPDDTTLQLQLRASSNDALTTAAIAPLRWVLKVRGNVAETPLFVLKTSLLNEAAERYIASVVTPAATPTAKPTTVPAKTEISAADLTEFYADGSLLARPFSLPAQPERLKPVSYLRNYEELIGLYTYTAAPAAPLTTKTAEANYERHYIASAATIATLVEAFTTYLDNPDLTAADVRTRVITDATKLWNEAVAYVQGGALDDRPLYWARIRMQVRLKQHPVFKAQFDFSKAVPTAGSEVEGILIKFEKGSRNYLGVSFSGAEEGAVEGQRRAASLSAAITRLLPSVVATSDTVKAAGNQLAIGATAAFAAKKDLLLTGFDPFVLDPERNGNPLQSNPSGIAALRLHGTAVGQFFVQTMLIPVRYKDFGLGGGDGIIEQYIEPFISSVDMVITVSQSLPFVFNVDRFASRHRGGLADNMNRGTYGDATGYTDISNGERFYETTLPYAQMVTTSGVAAAPFPVYFDQSFDTVGGASNDLEKQPGTTPLRQYTLPVIRAHEPLEGSGGNYLSNEIFYRVARLRAARRAALPTGHLHIPQTQGDPALQDPRLTRDIHPLQGRLQDQIQAIIQTIH